MRPPVPLSLLHNLKVPSIWDPSRRDGHSSSFIDRDGGLDSGDPPRRHLTAPGLLVLLPLPPLALSLSVSAIDAPRRDSCIASSPYSDREMRAGSHSGDAGNGRPAAVLACPRNVAVATRRRAARSGKFYVSVMITVMLTIASALVLSPGAFGGTLWPFPQGSETVSLQSPFLGVLIAHLDGFCIDIAIGRQRPQRLPVCSRDMEVALMGALSRCQRVALRSPMIFCWRPIAGQATSSCQSCCGDARRRPNGMVSLLPDSTGVSMRNWLG